MKSSSGADEKRQTEAYQTLVRLFDTTHTDNMKILKALIYAKDDLTPLFCGMTKRRVSALFSSEMKYFIPIA